MALILLAMILAHLGSHLSNASSLLTARLPQAAANTVVTLPPNVQPENLIMRRNDQILVTSASVPELMQIDPFAGQNQTVRTVARFEGYASTTGIVEIAPDIFAIGVGNYTGTLPPHGVSGTWNVFLVNLTGYTCSQFDPGSVRIEKQVAAPQINDIDGLALINSQKGLVAAADFTAGIIWLINVRTGEISLLAEDPQLAPATPFDPANLTAINETDPVASIGVNGLKYYHSSLYFTDFAKGLYGSIPIDPNTGNAIGPVTTTFRYGTHLDDIALSETGNVYLTTYDAPGLGVIRRKAGTPEGENGTDLLVPVAGANAVVLNETSSGCTLFINKALPPYSIMRADVEGRC